MGLQFTWFVDFCSYFSWFRGIVAGRAAYDVGCMDGKGSYPLVAVPDQETAVSGPSRLIIHGDDPGDDDSDLVARLWRAVCLLGVLLLLARILLESLRRQIVELRCQAHYWRAQHGRAVQREADLKEQVQRLQAEIREWERRVYGRKSETSATKNPQPKATSKQGTIPKPRSRGQQPNLGCALGWVESAFSRGIWRPYAKVFTTKCDRDSSVGAARLPRPAGCASVPRSDGRRGEREVAVRPSSPVRCRRS